MTLNNMQNSYYKLGDNSQYLDYDKICTVFNHFPSIDELMEEWISEKNAKLLFTNLKAQEYTLETLTPRELYLSSYTYFLSRDLYDFLMENEQYEVCTACSWSWIYDNTGSPKCWACNWKWYITEEDEY